MSDIPIPTAAKKHLVGDTPTLSLGAYFAEHRALIDSRMTHLSRVGIGAPVTGAPVNPTIEGPHELATQAKVLAMPAREDALLMALPADSVPDTPPATYEARKLPKLPGVNADLTE